tara:strand:- start:43 stop:705 length:663 start_codon:yes stop_codon:yes gene_type:complete
MIVTLIPAKKYSSRLTGKNRRILGNKPLFEHTIDFVVKSNFLKNCYISSDDKKILNRAQKLGCGIIERPKKLAKEKSSMEDVIFHSIKHLEKKKIKFKSIILLQPTSPFRPRGILKKMISIYLKNKKTVVTVKKTNNKFLKSILSFNKENKVLSKKYFNSNTQALPKLYMPNGSIYIFDKKNFLKNKVIPLNRLDIYETKKHYNIDIDDLSDLTLAKQYV